MVISTWSKMHQVLWVLHPVPSIYNIRIEKNRFLTFFPIRVFKCLSYLDEHVLGPNLICRVYKQACVFISQAWTHWLLNSRCQLDSVPNFIWMEWFDFKQIDFFPSFSVSSQRTYFSFDVRISEIYYLNTFIWNFLVTDFITGFVLWKGQSIHRHVPSSIAEGAQFMSCLKR